MKRYRFFTVIALAAAISCSKSADVVDLIDEPADQAALYHEEIVLGDKLENPYTLANVKSAVKSLYPTKAVGDIVATDKYVRFLPQNRDQLACLQEMGLVLTDHPVDFEIVKEGDYYHDPSVPSDAVTWQYALVPYDFEFPEEIPVEVLDECYLADNAVATKATEGIDWAAVECEAFRLTGNSEMLVPATKAGGTQPEGRITLVDELHAGGQPEGLSGVMVACNVFVKISTAYTDRDGYYKIPKSFTASPRYRLVFKNNVGFTIGFNAVLVPASVSTLGKNPASGVNVSVTADSDRKLFRRSVVNNAAYDFYKRCESSDLGLSAPPKNLCFWMFDSMDFSSAVMLHHGAVLNKDSSNKWYAALSYAVSYFAPDITLGTKNLKEYCSIYSLANHEIAHAAHFGQVGTEYWNKYIMYIARSFISGKDMYGDGTGEGYGYCAVGEMWAYYIENKFYKERYGGANPGYGNSQWFHPQILTYLEDRGISPSMIQKALGDKMVSSVDDFHSSLLLLCPEKKTEINQVFNRYE